jgi:hypothetical protein
VLSNHSAPHAGEVSATLQKRAATICYMSRAHELVVPIFRTKMLRLPRIRTRCFRPGRCQAVDAHCTTVHHSAFVDVVYAWTQLELYLRRFACHSDLQPQNGVCRARPCRSFSDLEPLAMAVAHSFKPFSAAPTRAPGRATACHWNSHAHQVDTRRGALLALTTLAAASGARAEAGPCVLVPACGMAVLVEACSLP